MKRKTAIIVLSCLVAFCIVACILTAVITWAIVKPKEPEVECIDGCDIPRYDENGNEVFAVVSPVGYCKVDMIKQVPRLDTLDNKTIALVGGSFMASTTHFEIKKCIEEEYENVTIYMFNQVGTAGNFAVPTNKEGDDKGDTTGHKTQVQRFQDKLKELGVDAVIGGNGGCGICTMKETGSAIAAEYIGVPAVIVASPMFVNEVHSIGVSRGVPVVRAAEYPGAFATHTEKQLKENARYVVWPQIKKALTEDITQAEINLYKNNGERPYDEIIYYGNNDEVQDYFKYNEWTDGLPIGMPTPAKVKEYLKFTPYKEDDILGGDDGMILQANRTNYVYTVAANAVMSGVPAEFMPLCIAFVECMDYGDWYRTLISSHQWSPYAWLNGPVARQLGIDYGQGAISEETNKALGRFIDLAMLNIGGYYIKENRAGTFGYLTPFTFAEDEESCLEAGWMPYPSSVVKNYDLDKNYITAASALSWGENVATSTDKAEKIMQTMAFDITEKQENGLGTIDPHVYRTVLMTKDVAMALSKVYTSKEMLEDALIETARRPVIERAYALYYANTGSQQDKVDFNTFYNTVLADLKETSDARLTDTPEWLKGTGMPEKMWTFAAMAKGETPMVVTGDTSRNKFQVMPGGGYATVEIKLPDNWDELLAPLGYEPLSAFYLSDKYSDEKADIVVPEGLDDGTYILISTTGQLSRNNRLYFDYDNIQFNVNGVQKTVEIDREGAHKKLATLLTTLKASPSSIVVKDGKVVEVIIRPLADTNNSTKDTVDLSALKYLDYGTAKITFAINIAQSTAAGSVSKANSSVNVSATIEELWLNIGNATTISAVSTNTEGFITLSGDKLTINTKAASGSVCKFTAEIDGTTYTLTFTMKPNNQISIEYGKTV